MSRAVGKEQRIKESSSCSKARALWIRRTRSTRAGSRSSRCFSSSSWCSPPAGVRGLLEDCYTEVNDHLQVHHQRHTMDFRAIQLQLSPIFLLLLPSGPTSSRYQCHAKPHHLYVSPPRMPSKYRMTLQWQFCQDIDQVKNIKKERLVSPWKRIEVEKSLNFSFFSVLFNWSGDNPFKLHPNLEHWAAF